MEYDPRILETAKAAAVSAGEYVREARKTGMRIEAKSFSDLVTDHDREAEERIRAAVSARFPDHRFFGEESSCGLTPEQELEEIRSCSEEEYVWVTDPIDGTVNYVRDIPQYAVSIAVMRGGEILTGVIYDPVRRELFYAEKGRGAFCSGRPVHVSHAPETRRAVINTSIAGGLTPAELTAVIPRTAERFRSLRVWNCTALGLASVACGRLDASYEFGIHLWDMAAGILLVREAGGTVSLLGGEPWTPESREVLATNGRIHRQTAEILGRRA